MIKKMALVSLIITGFFFMSASVQASTLSDALIQIKNLKNEIVQLKSKMSATAAYYSNIDSGAGSGSGVVSIIPTVVVNNTNHFTPSVLAPSANSITQTSATLGAVISSAGYPADVSANTIYYGTTPHPTSSSKSSSNVISTGFFSVPVTSLICGTQYYYYGSATNSTGQGYSADGTFTTAACSMAAPVLKVSLNPVSPVVTKIQVPVIGTTNDVFLLAINLTNTSSSDLTLNKLGLKLDKVMTKGVLEDMLGIIYLKNSNNETLASSSVFNSNGTADLLLSNPLVLKGNTSQTLHINANINSLSRFTSGDSLTVSFNNASAFDQNGNSVTIIGSANGSAQTFYSNSTVSTPSITVLSPNGGTYTPGQEIVIDFTTQGLKSSDGLIFYFVKKYKATGLYSTIGSKFAQNYSNNDGEQKFTTKVFMDSPLLDNPAGDFYAIAIVGPDGYLSTGKGTIGYSKPFTINQSSSVNPSIFVTSSSQTTNVKLDSDETVISFDVSSPTSDVNINAFKISFENLGVGSVLLSDYLNQISAYTSTGLISQLKVSDFVKDGNVFSGTIVMPQGYLISAGKSRTFYVKIKTNSSLSDENKYISWKISAKSIRYTASNGYVSTDSNVVENNFTVGNLVNTFPVGCTSLTGFSVLTGFACGNTTPTVDTTCLPGQNFSSITGKLCSGIISTNISSKGSLIARTLKIGMIGDDVKTLQQFLGITVDGIFSTETVVKLIEWQKANGLTPDGSFGPLSKRTSNLQ